VVSELNAELRDAVLGGGAVSQLAKKSAQHTRSRREA
jgi:hypothetical protein